MNYLPPLRNYRQMVRVVRDNADGQHLAKQATNFKLGNAFGDHNSNEFDDLFGNSGVSPTELQIRTLDSMNLPSSSLRRPGKTGSGGIYPARMCSSLFHDLNDSSQDYLNGVHGDDLFVNRGVASSGTKFRTELSPNAANKLVYQHSAITSNNRMRSATSTANPQLPESHFPTSYNKMSKHRSSSHQDINTF